MQRAVHRITDAMRNGERIAVYADFDADGIPGAVVLHDAFKKIGYENFEIYIPHRDTEGFGFHESAVQKLCARGVKLIITVDVGISGFNAARSAKELGIDVVITDHHVPDAQLPDAYAVINPKKQHDEYPFKELCGAAVAFKVVCALFEHLRNMQQLPTGIVAPPAEWEKWLLDMVGIATIADMVPLLGENRVLARYGLLVLRKTRRLGLQALMRVTRIRQHRVTEDDIGFFIAPRINAASRMDSPDVAFRLLTTHDAGEAESVVKLLEQLNRKRKTVVAQITKVAHTRVHEEDPIIVLGNPDWKPSFLGLAAQSLSQSQSKTVCLWGREGNGTYKGSCRTSGDVSLPELFNALGDVLVQYGGHTAAGGFSFSEHTAHTLREEFIRAYRSTAERVAAAEGTIPQYAVSVSMINTRLHTTLQQCAPFGLGNEKPVFVVRARVDSVRRFGKGEVHLECILKSEDASVRAVSFFYEDVVPVVGDVYTCKGTCEYDTFKGGLVFRINSVGR